MTVRHYTKTMSKAPELLDNGRKSVGVHNLSSWSPQQLFAVHGILAAFAFVVLMPVGVAGIRSGHHKSFRMHWLIQACSVSIAMPAIVLGVYLAWGHPIQVTRLFVHEMKKGAKEWHR